MIWMQVLARFRAGRACSGKEELKRGMRLGRLATHFVSLQPHDRYRKEDEKMEIKCVTCGRAINLDHAIFENYFGPVKCFSCSSMMEVKIKEKVLHGAILLTLKGQSPGVQKEYAHPNL